MMETERLVHRKFTFEDLDKLIELRSSDEVIKFFVCFSICYQNKIVVKSILTARTSLTRFSFLYFSLSRKYFINIVACDSL